MTDIPIIFSGPMVMALLREVAEPGTGKQMTRRLAWRKTKRVDPTGEHIEDLVRAPSPWQNMKPDDRLYVREGFWRYGGWVPKKDAGKTSYTFKPAPWHGDVWEDCDNLYLPSGMIYAEDFGDAFEEHRGKFGQAENGWHSRPSIFLDREFSRITLVVTSTMIERIQDISDADCEREGVVFNPHFKEWYCATPLGGPWYRGDTARDCFISLWKGVNGADAWDMNPEVVAVSFKVHAVNIDKMEVVA